MAGRGHDAGPAAAGLGEILDVGIKLYLRHWKTLMGCVVCIVLPVQIISVLITLSIAPEQLDFTASETAGVASDEEGASSPRSS